MSRSTGQILRWIGLAIEVCGLVAQALWTRADQTGAPLPGNFSSRQVWIVVGAGFLLWMVGTVLIYWGQPGRSTRSDTEEIGERWL
jgi:hypothetical protein